MGRHRIGGLDEPGPRPERGAQPGPVGPRIGDRVGGQGLPEEDPHLVAGRALHHRDPVELPAFQGPSGLGGEQRGAVGHRGEAQHELGCGQGLGGEAAQAPQYLLVRRPAAAEPGRRGDPLGHGARLRHERLVGGQRGEPRVCRDGERAGAALHDRPVEQTGRGRGSEVHADAQGAGGLAEDGDVAGIAAEAGGVGPHPAQGGLLVGEREVGGAVERGMPEEPEDPEPVVDRDDHGPARRSQPARPVQVPGAVHEPAAVEPDHDGPAGGVPGRRLRSRHVEEQAVLRAARAARSHRGQLHATGPGRTGVPYVRPARGGLREPPAQRPGRRGGVRDALEGEVPGGLPPAHRSPVGVDDGPFGGAGAGAAS